MCLLAVNGLHSIFLDIFSFGGFTYQRERVCEREKGGEEREGKLYICPAR